MNQNDDYKLKKIRRIALGLFLFIVPIPLHILISSKFGFPNELVEIIVSLVLGFTAFFGFFILSFTTIVNNSASDNSIIRVNGRVVTADEARNMSPYPIILKMILVFVACSGLMGIFFLILEDPFSWFENFENAARIQMFLVFIIVIIVNGLYIKIKGIYFSKTKIIIFLILGLIIFLTFYEVTIPEDANKKILDSTEFETILENYGYSINKINEIYGLSVDNSDIFLAERENINIYYIVSDKVKTSKRIFEQIDQSDFSDCLLNGQGTISGSYKSRTCENPNYIKIAYKIKNTIMYAEAPLYKEDIITNIFKEFGYTD